MRNITNFNSDWYFTKESEVATEIKDSFEKVTLPHTWNAVDGQDGGNDYYRGTCQYVKNFATPDLSGNKRAVLEFLGAAMTAEVYVNGEKLAHHEDGYSTFRVDITDALSDGENLLVVTCDNGENDRVYPQKADFTFYGGIYRDVNLLIVEESHFELIKDGTGAIKVTPVADVEAKTAKVTVETWQNDGRVNVKLFAPNGVGVLYFRNHRVDVLSDATLIAEKEVASSDGTTVAEFDLADVRLWNGVKDPYLYIAVAELLDDAGNVVDEVSAKFGIRTIDFDPDKGFFLNKESYPLRGVSRHQDRQGVGNALTAAMHEEDLDIILDIGANTVRLAHYQQSQYFYDLCDEAGLVVWAEIPYITMHMANGRENTLLQMKELITQSYNHASIVCWGLSNEITAASPVNEDLIENHHLLNDLCHEMDKTRPTTMAHVFMLETDSEMIDISDIGSYNLYFGWYVGVLEQNEEFFDQYHAEHPDRVMGFSEYGADANPAYHSATPDRGDYSEEYQCVYHEHIVNMINERPYLWATHVWNLFDFAADGRDEGGKHGTNQKGLVTMDRTEKKDAYYIYKANWSEEKFVHLCGTRYVDRVGDTTELKAYSNCEKVTFVVNGVEYEGKEDRHVFTAVVPLDKDLEVTVTSGELSESMTIQKVAEVNKSYMMESQQAINNWFDGEIDPEYLSIEDTLGTIMANPTGGAIMQKIMAKAAASRGDVATATSQNDSGNMMKMMARMKLSQMLKQAGDALSAEEIKQLNRTLQSIKK